MIKKLNKGDWIIVKKSDLKNGDILRLYDEYTDGIFRISMLEDGLSELIKVPDYYKEDNTKPYNCYTIDLCQVLPIEQTRLFIKSLIGKCATSIGRYQFKFVYTQLYDYLEDCGVAVRKKEKPHIDFLNKRELHICEIFLRNFVEEYKINIWDTLEKYGKLADEELYEDSSYLNQGE